MGLAMSFFADQAQDTAFRAKDGIDGADCHTGPPGDRFDGGAGVTAFQEQSPGSRDNKIAEWIKLPIFNGNGVPHHERGVVPAASGLYFVGLHFQTALTSALMGGVGKDAEYITRFMRNS
jgi:hypothetical protein